MNRCKKWYAVQNGSDYDYGYGSTDKRTARKMATQLHRDCPGEEIRIVTCRVDDDFCEAEEIIYEGRNGMNDKYYIAERIRKADEWDPDDCRKLCELAGLSEEWTKADGETFEQVVYKAAEILGVEVI